jgi:hypothetical protein
MRPIFNPCQSGVLVAALGLLAAFGVGLALAQSPLPPSIRTPYLIQVKNLASPTNALCIQRDASQLSSRSLTLQSCDFGKPAQMFFFFQPQYNLDLQIATGSADKGRIVPVYREVYAFTGDHLVGSVLNDPNAMITLGSEHGDPAAPGPIATPPSDALWKVIPDWQVIPGADAGPSGYARLQNTQATANCLSFAGDNPIAGAKVQVETCSTSSVGSWRLRKVGD